jgi:transcriptional regulator with XRE-family HTH domain
MPQSGEGMMATFGERLAALRRRGRYSQRELATAAGISVAAVRDYEQGRRAPSLETALRLAYAMGWGGAAWDGCADLTRCQRLADDCLEALAFGKYKGRLLSEVPLVYLSWLDEEMPTGLSPEQREAVGRLLRARGRETHEDRRRREQEAHTREVVELDARRAEALKTRRQEAQRPAPGPRMGDTMAWEPIPQVAEQSAEAGDQGQRLPRDDTNKGQDD